MLKTKSSRKSSRFGRQTVSFSVTDRIIQISSNLMLFVNFYSCKQLKYKLIQNVPNMFSKIILLKM